MSVRTPIRICDSWGFQHCMLPVTPQHKMKKYFTGRFFGAFFLVFFILCYRLVTHEAFQVTSQINIFINWVLLLVYLLLCLWFYFKNKIVFYGMFLAGMTWLICFGVLLYFLNEAFKYG